MAFKSFFDLAKKSIKQDIKISFTKRKNNDKINQVSSLFLAFSLVELMISLVTISCIAAAFAPVMTKRLQSTATSVGAGALSTDCSKFGGKFDNSYPNISVRGKNKCQLCRPDKCVLCYYSFDIDAIPSNKKLNFENCVLENK